MKASFHFDLPEERQEFAVMSDSGKLLSALWEFREYLRRLEKYEDRDIDKMSPRDVLSKVRNDFHEITSDIRWDEYE